MTSTDTAAPPPAAADLESRGMRNGFLALSAFVFAASAVLFAASLLLQLIEAAQGDAPSEFVFGAGLQMLSPAIAIPALVLAGLAFLVRARRAPRLRTASAVLAAAFATGVAGDALIAHVAGTQDAPTKVIAGTSAEAAGDLGLAVAAVIAAVAFTRALPRRDRLLGWGSGAIAIAFAFTATSTFLFHSFVADLGATEAYKTGVNTGAAGDSTMIVGALVAAVGFFNSSRLRDVLLGAATAIFALGFLLSAIGVTKVAKADPDNGFRGKELAADWVAAVGYYGLVLTAVCAAAGFLVVRRVA